ncbi:biotin-dependent carboxyltransferase family protein [Pseudomarimonas arenosa]|uniref:Biotin-dependent carboxyltransferase family protein n=1 Tax=Pseudomarimonas arenosa TaxID=2774145 RepID=A0AAW3ZMP2_9GAMM|nr:biotin-dependent carboxyltransferase family protein [Pseudomarimonas arenosa]MBD8527003.1 biotin-dependent carboxyltransferase family protein [Pseudomarimonas arenosa]
MNELASSALASVLSAGLLCSLQDAGRPGLRRLGIAAGGAADLHAYQLTCRLLSAAPGCAALEIWQSGLHIEFHRPARIAAYGADAEIDCNGQRLALARPVELPAGTRMRVRRLSRGSLFYLCVDGGWRADFLMGSAATDLRAGFGGLHGRALREGDQLFLAHPPRREVNSRDISSAPAWWLAPPPSIRRGSLPIRFLAAAQMAAQIEPFTAQSWRVGADSNRQGLRLQGTALAAPAHGSLLSRAVLPGTLQLPPNGLPIVLGVDAQTIGGYPVMGQVIQADLGLMAQCRPSSELRFQPVSLEQAVMAYRAQQAERARTELAIEQALVHWRDAAHRVA